MLWYWSYEKERPVLGATETHTCRRWKPIHDWSKERMLDPEEANLTASERHKLEDPI